MSKGFDTTANCAPHIPAIKAAGMSFVGRYYSFSPWKSLTRAEALALSKAGLFIVAVWESAGDHASFFTHSQGLADGEAAWQFAQRMGQPVHTPIYFAVDCDVPGAGGVHEYFEGVRDAFMKHEDVYPMGVYGSGAVCKYLLQSGLVNWTWLAQSSGWSGSGSFIQWNIRQHASATLAGMDIDYDETCAAGGGGFQVG